MTTTNELTCDIQRYGGQNYTGVCMLAVGVNVTVPVKVKGGYTRVSGVIMRRNKGRLIDPRMDDPESDQPAYWYDFGKAPAEDQHGFYYVRYTDSERTSSVVYVHRNEIILK